MAAGTGASGVAAASVELEFGDSGAAGVGAESDWPAVLVDAPATKLAFIASIFCIIAAYWNNVGRISKSSLRATINRLLPLVSSSRYAPWQLFPHPSTC
jgi:hypothetical protein